MTRCERRHVPVGEGQPQSSTLLARLSQKCGVALAQARKGLTSTAGRGGYTNGQSPGAFDPAKMPVGTQPSRAVSICSCAPSTITSPKPARKRDDIANRAHARQVAEEPVEADTKPTVRRATPAAEIDVPVQSAVAAGIPGRLTTTRR